MLSPTLRVAQGLLLHGRQLEVGALDRQEFIRTVGVSESTFRSAADVLGAKTSVPGLQFFHSLPGRIRFGPGAGLVLSIAVGRMTLRAGVVDANGALHHERESTPIPEQLSLAPQELLDRIRDAASKVLKEASDDEDLLVEGQFPFLGLVVAWAVPIDRSDRPLGQALSHPSWRSGASLADRVSRHLSLPRDRSYAINTTRATAITVAWHESRTEEYPARTHPRPAMVMRLAGGISSASIVVEPPHISPDLGQVSGFPASVLIAGDHSLAGELGHTPVDIGLIDKLNNSRPKGLGELVPWACSCRLLSEPSPHHLEAYASSRALLHRVYPHESGYDALQKIIGNPEKNEHHQALWDTGALVGHALTGPIATLDPATVWFVGPLAVQPVLAAAERSLSDADLIGSYPAISLLDPSVGGYAAVRGAGLSVLRNRVFRRFELLLGGRRDNVHTLVQELTHALPRSTGLDYLTTS